MSNLKREKRPDKNGKLVTRIVLADSQNAAKASTLPPPSVQTPDSESEAALHKDRAQYIAYDFLKDAGHSREDYSQRHFVVYKKLMKLPSDVLEKVESILHRDGITGIGTKYLAEAHDKGLLADAAEIVSSIALPHLDELEPGIHGVVGALRALPDSCVSNGYTMREGKEQSVLAFLKLECALDRNNVFGKCDEIKEFAIANPHVADRLVRAIDERQTADPEILIPMVEADSLAEGVL